MGRKQFYIPIDSLFLMIIFASENKMQLLNKLFNHLTNKKLKTSFLFAGLCILTLCAWTARTTNPTTQPIIEKMRDTPPGYEEIELRGSLAFGVGPNAIEAGYNENSVYIQFNQNLGYVDVTIYNPSGLTVYSDVVNTAVQQQVIVPITGLVDGVYTIVLENATGYADGEFEKNP